MDNLFSDDHIPLTKTITMTYCSNCGTALQNDANFCLICGTKNQKKK
jgi:rRNA maturation endonuclease Nob1